MKLYLSSMSPADKTDLLNLLPKKDSLSMVIVPNAWDTYPKDRRNQEINGCIKSFKSHGVKITILDLTKVNESTIKKPLEGTDLIWVMGGNTFYLNFYAQKSGFSKYLKTTKREDLVYAGESAGAVIAGKTLHGIEHLDDPELAPEIIWDGINLLDKGIIPHWGWEKYGEDLNKVKSEMEKSGEIIAIDNDKAIFISDEKIKTVIIN